VPLSVGVAGSSSNTMLSEPRPTSVPSGIPGPSSRLTTINMGRKVGVAAVPLSAGGAGSPSNTMRPGTRPTSVPSGILIRRTVCPQYTNVRQTDRQTDRQTSRLVFTASLRPQFRMPPVSGSVVRIRGMMRTQHFWIRTSLSSTAAARRQAAMQYTAAARFDRGRLPEWQTSRYNSSVSFVQIESNFFFTIHRRYRRKK